MLRELFVVALICVTAVGCGKPGQPPPATAATQGVNSEGSAVAERQHASSSPARRFTGTLRGGVVAIGAETTGWVLERDGGSRVDVDVSNVADAAAELEGKSVVIEGDIVTAEWVERGAKQLLIADSIAASEKAQ